jgi:hypothetical protein
MKDIEKNFHFFLLTFPILDTSTLVFGNETSKSYIEFSVNGYYSKWVFRE